MPETSIYMFHGDDEYRVSQAARELVDRLVPEERRSFGLEVVSGATPNNNAATLALREAVEAVQTAGFLGDGKVVWLRDIDFLKPRSKTRGEAGGDEDDPDEFKRAVAEFREMLEGGVPPGHILVLSGCGIARNNAVYKTAADLAKKGRVKLQAFNAPSGWNSDKDAIAILMDNATKAGRPISRVMAQSMVERVGADTRSLIMELEKLLTYVGDREPTIEDIAEIVTASRDSAIWDLQDAFGERDTLKTLTILRRLENSGVSPIPMVLQLIGRVNDLLIVRDSLDRRFATASPAFNWARDLPPQAAEAVRSLDSRFDPSRKHSFVVGKLLSQCRRFRRAELRKARHVLMEAHEQMVSLSVPPGILIEAAVMRALA